MLSVSKFTGVLVLITGSIVSVVLSSNLKVVRRHNPDTNTPHLADLFSNSQCPSSNCPGRSTCVGMCCMCKCDYDRPNVVVNETRSRCMNYGETNRIPSTTCQYSFRDANEPLEVLTLTETAIGKVKFTSTSVRVNCDEDDDLDVEKWQFLDGNGQWQNGEGDVFTVDFKTVGGQDGNKKDLTFLEWSAKLDAKYAGLLIKLSLKCEGVEVGCILAKINGTHTYNIPTSNLSYPPLSTSTSVSGQPTSSPGPSTVRPGVPVGRNPSTASAPTRSAAKQAAPDENTGSLSKAARAALGAIGGVICLIALGCLIVALYRRRKKWLSEKALKDPKCNSEVKLQEYEDPLYAELPDKTAGGDFDNPIYCDPTEEQIKRRSRQDPLPALPQSDSTYQPLDQGTRKDQGRPDPPAFKTLPEESSDYLNPDRGSPSDNTDYDNPPLTIQNSMNNESSDYDNPPVQGTSSPPMTSQNHQNQNFESSDYDNPPVQGNSDTSRENSDPNSTTSPSESKQDGDAEPDYFELEPEDSAL